MSFNKVKINNFLNVFTCLHISCLQFRCQSADGWKLLSVCKMFYALLFTEVQSCVKYKVSIYNKSGAYHCAKTMDLNKQTDSRQVKGVLQVYLAEGRMMRFMQVTLWCPTRWRNSWRWGWTAEFTNRLWFCRQNNWIINEHRHGKDTCSSPVFHLLFTWCSPDVHLLFT